MDGLAAGHDATMQMIDTSVVRVHQHGPCIADNNHQDMGRSRGGLTSKIHAVVDTNGLPVHLALTPGEAHDNRLCSVLLSALLPQTMLLADRGYALPARLQYHVAPRFRCTLHLRAWDKNAGGTSAPESNFRSYFNKFHEDQAYCVSRHCACMPDC